MFSNMDTSNSNDQSQGRSPIMLLLQQLLGLQQDQQTGAGVNQDTPSAPPQSSDHQDQPPPPPPTQQQAPPPPPSAPGYQHQQTPPPPFPSTPGHQHQQTPTPPPQQNQFCSNCSGSRGRQDDFRQYLENMIPIFINKCRHFSAVFTRSMFSVGSILMMICLLNAIPNTIISGILFMMICLLNAIPNTIISGSLFMMICLLNTIPNTIISG